MKILNIAQQLEHYNNRNYRTLTLHLPYQKQSKYKKYLINYHKKTHTLHYHTFLKKDFKDSLRRRHRLVGKQSEHQNVNSFFLTETNKIKFNLFQVD